MPTSFARTRKEAGSCNLYIGYIVNIIDTGRGFICTIDGQEDNISAGPQELFNHDYNASIGDIVSFEIVNSQETGQLLAINIRWLGWERPQEQADLLFAVARLGNPSNWLSSLASLAEEEIWSSKPRTTHRKDILLSYVQHTFIRLCEMDDAIKFFYHNNEKYMAFNTGLNSRAHLRDGRLVNIYAILKYTADSINAQAWSLTEFLASDICCAKYKIQPNLPVADYGQYDLTLFNPTKPVNSSSYHILIERSMRLPDVIEKCSREHKEDLLQASIKKALLKVQQNYTIATLQFFRDKKQSGELQWLIPFKWSLDSEETFAMPLQIDDESYTCKTILYLHMAYKNARLLRQPAKTEWLSSFMN